MTRMSTIKVNLKHNQYNESRTAVGELFNAS